MKTFRFAPFALCCACAGSPPEIWIDVSPVNVGIRSIAEDLEPYAFNLQFTNRGEQTLTLESVVFRGDQHCSFTFQGPDVTDLGLDDSAFLRGWWKPTVAGEDQIAMEVVSNAENLPLLVVPICGLGVTPETTEAEPIECVVPPDTQPDCTEE